MQTYVTGMAAPWAHGAVMAKVAVEPSSGPLSASGVDASSCVGGVVDASAVLPASFVGVVGTLSVSSSLQAKTVRTRAAGRKSERIFMR